MSLFNMVVPPNPLAPLLLASIGITRETQDQYPLGRVRDVYADAGKGRVYVLHRNYGETEAGDDADRYNAAMTKHPLYVARYPAPGGPAGPDRTYQVWEFRSPTDPERLAWFERAAGLSDPTPPMERFGAIVRAMERGETNSDVEAAVARAKPLVDKIVRALASAGPLAE